jgi:hippurate hydrolase
VLVNIAEMHELLEEANGLLPDVVRLRRSIHREPEVGLDLPLTQAKVLDDLHGLPLEIRTGHRTTSVLADLRGGRPGRAIVLRADMDALPLQEDTGLEFASLLDARRGAGRGRGAVRGSGPRVFEAVS